MKEKDARETQPLNEGAYDENTRPAPATVVPLKKSRPHPSSMMGSLEQPSHPGILTTLNSKPQQLNSKPSKLPNPEPLGLTGTWRVRTRFLLELVEPRKI